MRMWEATRLTAERRHQREAAALVNRLAEELASREEMLAALRADATLDEPLRQAAMQLAARHCEDPWQLSWAAFQGVLPSGVDAERCRRSVRQAEAALRLAPADAPFYLPDRPTTALGLTSYRLGQYREAVASLKRTLDDFATRLPSHHAARAGATNPPAWCYSILAMAHYRLNEPDVARTWLQHARERQADPLQGRSRPAVDLLREAEELMEGTAAVAPNGS